MSTPVASSSAIPLPVASGVTEQSLSLSHPLSHSLARHSPSCGGTAPTAFGAAKSHLSNGSASSSAASGCRLLWRGRLALGPKRYLEGIAIVAHLFTVPSISPSASIPHSSPFTEDPFAASSTSTSTSGMGTTSAADLCLGLEMMRGSDIKLVASNIKAIPKALAPSPVLCRTGSGQLDKGKAKEQVETVIVDTPTDLRIYIDPRCPETTTWFQDTFCRAGCEGNAVRLDAGGEEVIVFAPNLPSIDSSHNGSDSAPRPPITLSLGRAVKIGPRLPRPDDPMPRAENLFAKKLRRTTSMPMLDFQAPTGLKSINPLSRTTSLASIKERPVFDHRSRKLSTTASLSSLLSAEATSASRRTLQRSASSKDPFGSTAAPPSKPHPFRRSTSSLATTHPTRSTSSSSLAVPLKRSRSMMSSSSTSLSAKVMVESPPSSPTSEVSAVVRRRSSSLVPHSRSGVHVHDREGSPSPSCVSNTFEDEDEEMDDRLSELGARKRSTNSRSTAIGEGAIGRVRRSGMTRSESAPVGVFKLGLAPGNPARARRDRERSTSLAPSAAEGIEARNKAVRGHLRALGSTFAHMILHFGVQTIRKLLLSSLTSRGVTREDERFTEVFSITLRGVQFALRDTFKMSLLDKPHASDLIERHLDMYVPAPREPSIVVKHEEEETRIILEELLHPSEHAGGGHADSPEELGADGGGGNALMSSYIVSFDRYEVTLPPNNKTA